MNYRMILVEWSKHSFHYREDISFVSEVSDAKQSFELLKPNYNGCSTHEPNYGSMWQKIHQKSQPEIFNKTKPNPLLQFSIFCTLINVFLINWFVELFFKTWWIATS